MNDEIIKSNISKNLIFYRKQKGFTQAELAEAINYSDKSVSKWERGDGLPDICVLVLLAELFGVTINDLIGSELPKAVPTPAPAEQPDMQRVLVPLMAMGLVWLVAAVVFFALELALPSLGRLWLILVWAIPISCIVSIVFAELWWSVIPRIISVSALIWSLGCCVFITFTIQKMYLIFIIAAVLQLLTVLWFINIYSHRKHKKADSAD